jgi:hypothetical protein
MRALAALFFSISTAAVLGPCDKDKGNAQPGGVPSGSASAHPAVVAAYAPPAEDPSVLVPGSDPARLSLVHPTAATAIVDVNGDGTDDVVALARLERSSDEHLRIIALDGREKKISWASPRIQPAPKESPQARTMLFAGAGRVALMNQWFEIETFDLGSGKRLAPIALEGVPVDACADPSDAKRLYVDLARGRSGKPKPHGAVSVDLLAPSTSIAAAPTRPEWCPAEGCGPVDVRTSQAKCTDAKTEDAPKEPGFEPDRTLVMKDVVIVVGAMRRKTDGTRASGDSWAHRIDPATKKVLWKQRLNDSPRDGEGDSPAPPRSATGLGGLGSLGARSTGGSGTTSYAVVDVTPAGVLVHVATYAALQLQSEELRMLDLTTGAVRWKKPFRSSSTRARGGETIRWAKDILYVPQAGALDAVDPATGDTKRSFGGDHVLGASIVDAPKK